MSRFFSRVSIWRTRSRLIPKRSPTSCRVDGCSASRRKISSSLSFRVVANCSTLSLAKARHSSSAAASSECHCYREARPAGGRLRRRRLIQRDFAIRHPLLHFADFAFLDADPLGEQQRLRGESFRLQPRGFLLQIEEELALGLGGADFHQPPVVHQVTDDIRADPPHRVRREADATVGDRSLDRLDQADVALLNQVEQITRGAREFMRNLDHQAQIRGNQPQRVLLVMRGVITLGDFAFFFAAEQWIAPNLGQIMRPSGSNATSAPSLPSSPAGCAISGPASGSSLSPASLRARARANPSGSSPISSRSASGAALGVSLSTISSSTISASTTGAFATSTAPPRRRRVVREAIRVGPLFGSVLGIGLGVEPGVGFSVDRRISRIDCKIDLGGLSRGFARFARHLMLRGAVWTSAKTSARCSAPVMPIGWPSPGVSGGPTAPWVG